MSAEQHYDVVVVGGGSAGVVAAIQAGRAGGHTLLVERTSMLGGTTTNSGVNYPGLFHAWGRQIIAGIGWELVDRTMAESGQAMPDFSDLSVPFSRHQPLVDLAVFASVCDEAVLDAGVELLLHTMLAATEKLERGWQVTICTKSGLTNLRANVLIDCTGDASAAAMSGCPLLVPDACQPATMTCRLSGYSVEALDFQALNQAFREAVQRGELKAEDACQRTDRPMVEGWLRNKGVNASHVRADMDARTSQGRTRLEVEGRRAVRRLTRWLRRQGGLENLRVDSLGPEIGVRETVRIEGEALITLEDYTSGRVWPEALCYAFYPIDQHGMDTAEWQAWPLEHGTVPTVPRGALIPRRSADLLAAGRIISSDRLALSALRVQATCMATGQAAGAMAALSADSGAAASELDMADIKDLLREHGAIVPEG